jgi:hypothetical protein
VESGSWTPNGVDCLKAIQDVLRLQWHEPTHGDIAIAYVLQAPNRISVGTWTPALRHTEWLEWWPHHPVQVQELLRKVEGNVLSEAKLLRNLDSWKEVVPILVICENHVIDRNAEIELTFYVELEHIFHGIRWLALPHIGESTTITHDRKGRLRRNAEELRCAGTEQPVPLGNAIATPRLAESIHHALRNEQAVERRRRKDFVGVLVVTVARARSGSLLRLKIERRIDKILAIREEESHALLGPPCT